MQFSTESLIVASSIAAVSAQSSAQVTAAPYDNSTAVYTTETVTGYVTFCPSATTFVENKKTYTATTSQWITVTHCPNQCTITHQAGPSATIVPYVPAGNVTLPVPSPTTVAQKSAFTPGVFTNSTGPIVKTVVPVGTGALTTLLTTNSAGKTVQSVGVPFTTINSAGQTVTSISKVGESVATVVSIPAKTIVQTNSMGSTTVETHPATVATTSAVTIPAQTILTQGPSGEASLSTAAPTTIQGSVVTSMPSPSVVQTAGVSRVASTMAAFAVAGGVALLLL